MTLDIPIREGERARDVGESLTLTETAQETSQTPKRIVEHANVYEDFKGLKVAERARFNE